MSERPLHVRVAEALGWTGHFESEATGGGGDRLWFGRPPGELDPRLYPNDRPHYNYVIPRFDTDGNHTVGLIDEWELDIEHTGGAKPGLVFISGLAHCPTGLPGDEPYGGAWLAIEAEGPTTLIAVCNWLLAAEAKGACVVAAHPAEAAK